MKQPLETYYGLPAEVTFCKKCVMSNQRPASTVEFKHTKESKKTTIRHLQNNTFIDYFFTSRWRIIIAYSYQIYSPMDILARQFRSLTFPIRLRWANVE